MRDQLYRLVDEMVAKGILYEDARQEFERRFISRALARSKGNVGRAAKMIGIHRNTLSRKVSAYRLKRTGCSPIQPLEVDTPGRQSLKLAVGH